MRITEIYIDGFRNIKQTRLDFSAEPIIVLLAPNNYGKSNLLLGIQNGFDLIAKQGTQVVKYISNVKNYANWISKAKDGKFTFGVKFKKVGNPVLYEYRYALGYQFNKDEKVFEAKGVVEEYLKTTLNDQTTLLFKREISQEPIEDDRVLLSNKRKVIIPRDESGRTGYSSSLYLGLHKLGNMVIIPDKNGDVDEDILKIIKEISGALTSLTRENIGDIIVNEGFDFSSQLKLGQYFRNMYILDKQKHTQNRCNFDLRNCNKSPIGYFKKIFLNLFHYDAQIKPCDDENDDLFLILFKDEKKIKIETVNELSFGTRRIFKLLSQVIANGTPLLSIEEIEMGIHPKLYTKVIKTLFDVVDNNKFFNETGEERKNEPVLLISSHAPGIVNGLENHLDSVYISMPSNDNSTDAKFVKLNSLGKQKVIKYISETILRTGDYIFQRFSEEGLYEENIKLLDINEEKNNV